MKLNEPENPVSHSLSLLSLRGNSGARSPSFFLFTLFSVWTIGARGKVVVDLPPQLPFPLS